MYRHTDGREYTDTYLDDLARESASRPTCLCCQRQIAVDTCYVDQDGVWYCSRACERADRVQRRARTEWPRR